MQCPICSKEARNLTPNTLDGVVVGCDDCGDYRIAGADHIAYMAWPGHDQYGPISRLPR